ncbi:MAG: hypothetical protein MZV70_06180 [Desulfobacterales bacterium]|nr:hypothetical protein [Desulfobacterales bacterium]
MDAETKAALTALFAVWGEAPEVPEKDPEAYAMISAMGPTYMWFQWQTLRELGASFGLERSVARAERAILKTVKGAAECLLAGGRDPAKVMDKDLLLPLKDDEATIVAAHKS